MRTDITEIDRRIITSNIIENYYVNNLNNLQPYDEKLIRFGGNNDGGYLIPEILLGKNLKLISFGIGINYKFEEEWYEKISKNIVAYESVEMSIDETIFSQEAVLNTIEVDENNIIDILSQESKIPFYVKMDIENGEYKILDKIIVNENCLGMTVEFHSIFQPDHSTSRTTYINRNFLNLIEMANKLYNIVHVHCNNVPVFNYLMHQIHWDIDFPTDVIEITFLRKDICTTLKKRSNSLLEIDDRNYHANPEINLIF